MDLYDIGVAGAVVVGVGRALTGIAFLARPEPAARSWVGEVSTPTTYLTRGVGARDLVIGVGVLWAVVADASPAAWVLASVVGDASDAAFAAAQLDGDRKKRALALAGGFGVLGAATAALLLAG